MKNNINKLEIFKEYYDSFWDYTINKYNENKQKTGVYFWIKKEANGYYAILSNSEKGLNVKFLIINEKDLTFVEKLLQYDGFKFITTENNNKLVTINKESIENRNIQMQKQAELQAYHKMPITPFAETRHRK